MRLFSDLLDASRAAGKSPRAVVCVDSEAGLRVADRAAQHAQVVRVSARGGAAEIALLGEPDGFRTRVTGLCHGVPVDVVIPLAGAHNVENVALALGSALVRAPDRLDALLGALRSFPGVPGRLELVATPGPGEGPVFVDYAHTPDAVRSVLGALGQAVGDVVAVAGCGGDRDAGKRAPMGRAVAEGASRAVLTSDNPRTEDPAAIVSQMFDGVPPELRERVTIELDRPRAIAHAIDVAGGRCVALLGKGHEPYQEVAGRRFHLDDREEARRALFARAAGLDADAAPLLGGWDDDRLAVALGGIVARRGPRRGFAGLSTDTRSLRPGQVFVALRGPNHDAHDHLAAAARAGAGALVVSDPARAPADFAGTVVVVDDGVAALARLANAVLDEARRRPAGLHAIGITGSNGKTTTKEMAARIARARFGQACVTEGNRNNHIGLPLTVGGLRAGDRVAVLEMGANAPRDIFDLAAMARHEVGVLTSIGRAHLEGFGGTLDSVRAAKLGIATGLPPRMLVLPHSEALRDFVMKRVDATTNVLSFGIDDGTIIVSRENDEAPVEMRGHGTWSGWHASVPLALPGIHNAMNLAAAVLSCAWDPRTNQANPYDARVIVDAMRDLELPGGRLRSLALGSRVVIDDAYNANPDSVRASLAILAARPPQRIAVLGEMRELGAEAAELHDEVGRAAAGAADVVIGLGPWRHQLTRHAGGRGVDVDSAADAAAWLTANAFEGATVLVKASRGAALEAVVDALRDAWGAQGGD